MTGLSFALIISPITFALLPKSFKNASVSFGGNVIRSPPEVCASHIINFSLYDSAELKFVYSENNTLSIIFQNNDLLLGVTGEFNNNLKELEKRPVMKKEGSNTNSNSKND